MGPPRCQGSSHSQEAALTSLLGLPQERLHVCLEHTCSCEENRGARLPPEATLALLPSCSPAPAPGRVAVLPGPTRGPETWVLRPSGGEGWRAAEAGWMGGGSRQCYSEGLRAAGEGRPQVSLTLRWRLCCGSISGPKTLLGCFSAVLSAQFTSSGVRNSGGRPRPCKLETRRTSESGRSSACLPQPQA